jgi:hypothetical protein
MTRPHAVSLSDRQMKLVQLAASSLPVHLRDDFLRQLADRLAPGEVGDAAVDAAVNVALRRTIAYASGTDHRFDSEFEKRRA